MDPGRVRSVPLVARLRLPEGSATGDAGGRAARLASPLEHLPDAAGQAFANDKLLGVRKRQQPALAAERRHFTNMVDVDERTAVNAVKNRTAQALVNAAQSLSGHVALAGGDDPDDFALGLKGQHVIEIEQEVLLAGAADYLAAAGRGRRLGHFAEAG